MLLLCTKRQVEQMQNDLISRSEAYQRMVEETEQSGKCYIELSTIGRLLNDVPNAYNVKRVVKQLEEELKRADKEKERCLEESPLLFDIAKGYSIGISNAIDFVRNGGKE